MTPLERWLPVPGYEGLYEVSDLGKVRSLDRMAMTGRAGMKLRRGRNLAFTANKRTGHKLVTVCRDGKTKTFQVHRLVMLAFVGPCPDGMQVRHFPDRDPANNRLNNLSYGTPTENAEDRDKRHGRNFQSNKTHCPQGHEYTPENTYVVPATGVRQCKTCRDGGRPAPQCSKCDKPAKTKGLCGTHYQELRRSRMTDEKRDEIRRRGAERARQKRQNNAA